MLANKHWNLCTILLTTSSYNFDCILTYKTECSLRLEQIWEQVVDLRGIPGNTGAMVVKRAEGEVHGRAGKHGIPELFSPKMRELGSYPSAPCLALVKAASESSDSDVFTMPCAWTKYAPTKGERKNLWTRVTSFLGRKLGLQAKVRANDTGWNTRMSVHSWTLTSTALWQVKEVRQKKTNVVWSLICGT